LYAEPSEAKLRAMAQAASALSQTDLNEIQGRCGCGMVKITVQIERKFRFDFKHLF
jgi:hypothetical protein